MFQNPLIRQMNELKMFRKKFLSDETFLIVLSRVQNLIVLFNYLHDSNSTFRAAGINSEIFLARTVGVALLFDLHFQIHVLPSMLINTSGYQVTSFFLLVDP